MLRMNRGTLKPAGVGSAPSWATAEEVICERVRDNAVLQDQLPNVAHVEPSHSAFVASERRDAVDSGGSRQRAVTERILNLSS
jgi:hypothetical protein